MISYKYISRYNLDSVLNTILKDSKQVSIVMNNQSLRDLLLVISYLPVNCDNIQIALGIHRDDELKLLNNITNRDINKFGERWIDVEASELKLNGQIINGLHRLSEIKNIDIRIFNTTDTGIILYSQTTRFEYTIIGNFDSGIVVGDSNENTSQAKEFLKQSYNIFSIAQSNCRTNMVNIFKSALDKHYSICESDTAIKVFESAILNVNRYHIQRKVDSQESDRTKYIEYQYQTDAVNSLLAILNKYGLAYLADSVGLGKTITTIKLLNKTGYKALVIVPTDNIYYQWDREIRKSALYYNNIDLIKNSVTSLETILNNESELVDSYDIIIIDEAHNFKNSSSKRYMKALEICCGKQVLLLGATPITNRIDDFESQLLLGLDANKQYDFGVGPIGDYFDSLRKGLPAKSDIIGYRKAQVEIGRKVRNDIISKILIRRTRKDLESYYKQDIEQGTLKFPKINTPEIVKYQYPGIRLAQTLDILSGYNFNNSFKYAIYNKSKYGISDSKSSGKQNKKNNILDSLIETQGDSEDILESLSGNKKELNITGLMKVMLIKLLDSSPQAFSLSIARFMESLRNEIETYSYNDDYVKDLTNDLSTAYNLFNIWTLKDGVDIKAEKLREILNRHKGKKAVIFTEYIATADYLEEYLDNRGFRTLKIDGGNNKYSIDEVLQNFDNNDTVRNDYDVLISTNIMSEGINLGRTSVAINYDITWNPMVITQRVGRLNRINSLEDEIYIYNFFPCDEADSAILSESNIISKFALANISLGADDNYLTSEVIESKSMLEEREQIVGRLTNIDEEQLDFKTVTFKYSGEAQRIYSSVEAIPKRTNVIIMKGPENQSGVIKVYGVYQVDGNIVTCGFDSTKTTYYSYLNSNDVIDGIKEGLQLEPGNKNSKLAWEHINNMNDFIDRGSSKLASLRGGSKELNTIVNRLILMINKAYENNEINGKDYIDRLNKLRDISKNISSGYMKSNLSSRYAKQYNIASKNDTDILKQVDRLLSIINIRFHKLYNIADNTQTKCLAAMVII